MNRKKMITCALLLLCATGLRAMDSDGALADAAAREGGSEVRQRGGGAGSGGDAVAAALLGGGDGAGAAARGLTREQMIARTGRAGRHLRAGDVQGAWRALREDHRGAEETCDAVCCGVTAAGAAVGIPAFLYWALMGAMEAFAAS